MELCEASSKQLNVLFNQLLINYFIRQKIITAAKLKIFKKYMYGIFTNRFGIEYVCKGCCYLQLATVSANAGASM